MEVTGIEIDREEARKRVEEFTARRRRQLTELDHALYKGYKALAEGLAVIDVNKAIESGGQFPDNYCPKLALARSDVQNVYFNHRIFYDGDQGNHAGEFSTWSTQSQHERNENTLFIETSQRARANNAPRVDVHRAREVLHQKPMVSPGI